MKKTGIIAATIGTVSNFALFVVKLYVGISTNSLAVYCDAINNLGDTLACGIALLGFYLASRMIERRSARVQSLCTFVISIIIGVSGAYFVYNGLERMMYPLPISYSSTYAYIVAGTIVAKVLMGIMYYLFNKKSSSPVLDALIVDSFLDCFVTLCALMGLVLVNKIYFAIDGFCAIISGSIITISAIKSIITQSKFLVCD